MEKKIQERKNKLAEKQNPMKELKDGFEKLKRDVKKDTIKKIYKYFEKHNNMAVRFVFESLVGILRGT